MTVEHSTRAGVTLLELLIVMSVIALLFSVSLPAMTGARRNNERVVCMAGLRESAKGSADYAMEFEGWIIGSPSGSGAYLSSEPTAWGPAVQVWDFMGPMAYRWQMGLALPSRGDIDGVVKRFNDLRGHKAFLCPSNRFTAIHYAGPDAGSGPMVSYNTVRYQLWREEEVPPGHGITLPQGWRPSVNRIGNPANKVFCADGARYSTCTCPPDYDLTVNGPYGGAFSDTGTYSSWTCSWDRSRAPGNGYSGPIDARMYAFRHSTGIPPVGAPGNAYRLNLAFHDGHVETQGDLESTNPHQWLPRGTIIESAPSTCWNDTVVRFDISGDLEIGG
ncbi:MAG: type II secretion system protein [Phycisphaerae bacterium]|nr:type II secretion system protein [Phycisphaerae bacterium]